MTIKDLNKKQIHQLKERILMEQMENPSTSELAWADELVPDYEVEEHFGSVIFSDEDFF